MATASNRGLARLVGELTGAASPGARPQCWVESGVVRTVVPGYMSDPTITVRWRDTDVPVSYIASYTPTEGDVVLLLIQTSSVIVLGRLVGPTGGSGS